MAAEAPAHLQAVADRDAQVASLRQELAHASSGAGATSDEVIRLKAELESSHQVVHLCCTSGLRLLAPVLQTTLWAFAALKGCCHSSSQAAFQWLLHFLQDRIAPRCTRAVNVGCVQTAWVAWQQSGQVRRVACTVPGLQQSEASLSLLFSGNV